MPGRYTARHVDREPGWVERRFREMDRRIANLNTGKLSEVPGSTTTIEQILTDPGSIIRAYNEDRITLAEPGDATMELTYLPIPGSLHVYWGPIHVPSDRYVLDGTTLTVLDPDSNFRANGTLEAAYLYDGINTVVGTVEPDPTPPSGTLVDWESTGWKWLQVTALDSNDYSASAFDDSAWAAAAAAFGDSNPAASPPLTWPLWSTVWDQNTAMWARKTVAATAGVDLTVTIRLNRWAKVYLNGVELLDIGQVTTEVVYTIDGANVLASNKLAIRAQDDGYGSVGTGCYFDIKVEQ